MGARDAALLTTHKGRELTIRHELSKLPRHNAISPIPTAVIAGHYRTVRPAGPTDSKGSRWTARRCRRNALLADSTRMESPAMVADLKKGPLCSTFFPYVSAKAQFVRHLPTFS